MYECMYLQIHYVMQIYKYDNQICRPNFVQWAVHNFRNFKCNALQHNIATHYNLINTKYHITPNNPVYKTLCL